MTINGLILVAITLICFIGISLMHLFCQKQQWYIKFTKSYWTWFTIAMIGLIYFIAGRWVFDVIKLINFDDYATTRTENRLYLLSFIKSKVLFLDFCPFIYMSTIVILLTNKSKEKYKLVAAFGLIGGFLNLFFTFMNVDLQKQEVDSLVRFIFIGSDKSRLFFMMHFYLIVVCYFMMLNTTTYSKWDFIGSALFIYTFLLVSFIIAKLWNITNGVSGLFYWDYFSDEKNTFTPTFEALPKLFKTNNYGLCAFLLQLFVFIAFVIIVILKNTLTFNKERRIDYIHDKKRWYQYGFLTKISKPFYWIDNKWYQFETKINVFINKAKLSKKVKSKPK